MIETANPQDFKLRIFWIANTSSKLTADFSDCRWLPRIGETLVLPVDERDAHQIWHKFRVIDIVYDFQNQCTQVYCQPVYAIPQKASFDLKGFEQKLQAHRSATEPKNKESRELVTPLEYEFVQPNDEDVDKELEHLKSLMVGQNKKAENEGAN